VINFNLQYISTQYNKAGGRFVGPVALLNHAKSLLPELKPILATPAKRWRLLAIKGAAW
jgi:hypothetical protein